LSNPTHEPSIPTYPLPLKLAFPLAVPVPVWLLVSNSLESTSAPSDPEAEPGKDVVDGVNGGTEDAAGVGCVGLFEPVVKVAELPAEVEAEVAEDEPIRWIAGSRDAKSVYLNSREMIVGRRPFAKRDGNRAY
jgi:hypothetical protein